MCFYVTVVIAVHSSSFHFSVYGTQYAQYTIYTVYNIHNMEQGSLYHSVCTPDVASGKDYEAGNAVQSSSLNFSVYSIQYAQYTIYTIYNIHDIDQGSLYESMYI